jgi:hypothetical protein
MTELEYRIGIQPRTPFIALFRVKFGWHAWTAVRDMQQPYSKWQGTYLILNDDGTSRRVTIYDDGTEDVINIRRS